MNTQKTGEFYGTHYQKSSFENIIITDTEYTHGKVDWHYHENPYFTYLLQGKLFESNKKESYYLEPGNLLFHNWQDAHYNIKPPEFTRGFHIELNADWFSNFGFQMTDFEGSTNIKNPVVKNLISQVLIESKKVNDRYSNLSIAALLTQIFITLKEPKEKCFKKPSWVNKMQELLCEKQIDYSLKNISSIIELYPVFTLLNIILAISFCMSKNSRADQF